MRYYISLIAIAAFSISILAACAQNTPTTTPTATTAVKNNPAPAPDDNAPRMTLEEAKKVFDAGKAFIIDTRPADAFKQEHIKGAVNITSEAVEARLSEIPKDKTIIAYCS